MKPQAQIEYKPLSELKELPGNPRTIKKDQFEKLKKSLQDNADYFEARPIILSDRTGENIILAGNQRYKAAKALKMEQVPTITLHGLTEAREREIIIRDNVNNGEWDFDELANEWDEQELEDWGLDLPRPKTYEDGAISRDFITTPSTLILTSDPQWQERKNIWKSRIKSEAGRKKGLLGFSKYMTEDYTSIFDPVLAECLYKWFGIPNGTVLDPFAGGSVRGIVAGWLGMEYFGNDLSAEQVEENRKQAERNKGILLKTPKWSIGDSAKINDIIAKEAPTDKFDMIMSCPPYADLEVYSDDPADISNMPYEQFIATYRQIIKDSCAHLKENRFAVFVVGEIRNHENTDLRGFVYDTIKAFEDAGLRYYNHAIVGNRSNVCMRVRGHMRNRKLVHAHQDALVFTKGKPNSSEYERIKTEDIIEEMDKQRKLMPQNEDVLVFTNAQSNEALRENFEEIGGTQ